MSIISLLLKIVFGVVGLFFLLLGLMAWVFEVVILTAGDGRAEQVLGRVWFEHDPFFQYLGSPSIQLAQVVVERKIGIPAIWNPGITTILNWPSWLALAVVGLGGLVIGLVLLSLSSIRRSRQEVD